MVSRPHGGRLVRRLVKGPRREALLRESRELPKLEVSREIVVDLEDIALGAFSPLEGFLTSSDYHSVLYNMRLSDDLPWTIPIVLDASRSELADVKQGDDIALVYEGRVIALMNIEDVYRWDKKLHAEKVYGTRDPGHPGVAKTYAMKELLVGGKIDLLEYVKDKFEDYTLWPADTRVLFEAKGWRTIAAFQTRNVPHLGHEYVQKSALTFTDGLLVHPLIGWKKPGDYRDEVIVEAYKALISNYYPKDVVVLATLKMNMRYAGPREAVHHAIVRKNFGATHFIVGRDHAGVGSYYGPYDAWKIFDEFPDLGITPLFIREAFYCRKCSGMATEKTCPHSENDRIKISGTKLRSMLKRGEIPPATMMRPEVAKVIIEHPNPFV